MYNTTIIAVAKRNVIGGGLNPKRDPSRVKGRIKVAPTITKVVNSRNFPGVLLKKGRWLRMTSTTSDAEITDSTNQPVLN